MDDKMTVADDPILSEEYCLPPENEKPANQVGMSCQTKVLWRCKKGHEWRKGVSARFNESLNGGCPICIKEARQEKKEKAEAKKSNGRPFKPFRSLAEASPRLVKQYSPKNPIPADKIPSNSKDKVLWYCDVCGTEWEAVVTNRVQSQSGCRVCHRHSLTPRRRR